MAEMMYEINQVRKLNDADVTYIHDLQVIHSLCISIIMYIYIYTYIYIYIYIHININVAAQSHVCSCFP